MVDNPSDTNRYKQKGSTATNTPLNAKQQHKAPNSTVISYHKRQRRAGCANDDCGGNVRVLIEHALYSSLAGLANATHRDLEQDRTDDLIDKHNTAQDMENTTARHALV